MNPSAGSSVFSSFFLNSVLFLLFCLYLMPVAAFAAPATDECLECHRSKTPAAVRLWEESGHRKAGVGCADCHGRDHAKMEKGETRVGVKVCAGCHKKAAADHMASRHGMGLHSGWGCTRELQGRSATECSFCHNPGDAKPLTTVQCARFLKQSTEMGEVGCNRCHQVEASCASCHGSHSTDLAIVRDPAVCATCHMGPDHPQWEMWQTSRHGTLFSLKGRNTGPDCQTCHMPKGTHNVSFGITMSSGCVPYESGIAAPRRTEMLGVCSSCHGEGYSARELGRADRVREQGLLMQKQAESIVRELYDKSLLQPMPEKRPAHPLSGYALVLDSQLLYEDTSHIERLLFKLKKYDLAKMIKGAYHQNPAYTHWYGNAEVKLGLIDIRSEAERLRRESLQGRKQTFSLSTEEALEDLKRNEAGGRISPEDARSGRKKLIDGLFNPKTAVQ